MNKPTDQKLDPGVRLRRTEASSRGLSGASRKTVMWIDGSWLRDHPFSVGNWSRPTVRSAEDGSYRWAAGVRGLAADGSDRRAGGGDWTGATFPGAPEALVNRGARPTRERCSRKAPPPRPRSAVDPPTATGITELPGTTTQSRFGAVRGLSNTPTCVLCTSAVQTADSCHQLLTAICLVLLW
jgi:hypothetical protein